MVHLYFGAFDIVLYLGGITFAIAWANAICDSLDRAEDHQPVTTPVAPALTSTNPALVIPAKQRQDVRVRVSVGS